MRALAYVSLVLIVVLLSLGANAPTQVLAQNTTPTPQNVSNIETYAISRFTFSPSNPNENKATLFDASQSNSSGPITDYVWNFGDGTNETGLVTAAHVFTAAGNYTVSLSVKSADGKDTFSQVVTVSTAESTPDYTWLLILIIVLLIPALLLLFLFLIKRRDSVEIDVEGRRKCGKCRGNPDCEDCLMTPC